MTGSLPAVATPDSAALADAAADWQSAYVHIPFCRRRCPYCDFAVVTPEEGGTPDVTTRYVDAIVAEIAMEPVGFGPLDAVNFGGGTPSTLDAADVARVLEALDTRFGIAHDAEVSLEANPEDWNPTHAAAVVAEGVTRVSLGVQSFAASTLRTLGRAHTPEQALNAAEAARSVDGASVSLDLIFGTPQEAPLDWAKTVDLALDFGPDHLSAYALTVERGTALSRAVEAGQSAPPDPDMQADAYEYLENNALGIGLVRYEVSNYAATGHVARYNLGTWAQGEYVAFGLGAHSHRAGVRGRNVRRLEAYLTAVERSERPRAGEVTNTAWESEQERLMLGLRRSAGVEAGPLGTCFLASPIGRRLEDAAVTRQEAGRIIVAQPLLTDEVIRSVLSLSPGDC